MAKYLSMPSARILRIARQVDKAASFDRDTEQIIESKKFKVTRIPVEFGWNREHLKPRYEKLKKVDGWYELEIKGYDIKGLLLKAKEIPSLSEDIQKYINMFWAVQGPDIELRHKYIGTRYHVFQPEMSSRYDEHTGELLWQGVKHDLILDICQTPGEIYHQVLGVVRVTDSIVGAVKSIHKRNVEQDIAALKKALDMTEIPVINEI